jgi:glycosyltransferase involved in cell wall biosynthesis
MKNRKSKIENRKFLRVLCLNYEYPPVGGGGGRSAAQINTGLVARGHEVRVQTAGLRHLPTRETIDGVEIFRSESFRKKADTCTVPEMALFLVTSFLPTLRHVREWRPDVIHAHFAVPTGALALAAHLLTRTPYVLTAHLGDVPGGVPQQTAGLFRFVQPLTVPIWKKAAAITAVSTFVADLAERAYHRRPTVIPNGIRRSPRPEIEVHDPVRILWVGRLSEQKNPALALAALAQLRDLPWTLEVIGDGPLRPNFAAIAAKFGVADRVTMSGWLDSASVAARMAVADILLMTSHSEGLPMAAIEALDHGLAIVSTRIPGVADLVEDDVNGMLGDPTPESMAAALRRLLADPARLRRCRAASATAAARFDLDGILDSYEAILSPVTG